MKLIEITQKYFFVDPGAVYLLEAYNNPEYELAVNFTISQSELNVDFYKVLVYEKSTGSNLILVYFKLDKKSPNIITVDNIHTTQNVDTTKMVHTTAGHQISGVDMGHTAIKWLYKKIKEFALTQGFDIKKIISSTRYTGARAKNNPSTGDIPGSFNVNVNVKEEFIYKIDNDTIKYIFE